MVADALLAPGLQCIVFEIEGGIRNLPQIFFNDALVLCRRRHEAGVKDRALRIKAIAVIEDPARRLVQAWPTAARGSDAMKGRAGGS